MSEIESPDRRLILKTAGAGLIASAGFASPLISVASNSPKKGPEIPRWPQPGEVRQVWLRRPAAKEEIIARYYDGRNIRMKDYVACCRILRDVQQGVVADIDINLLDFIFAIQKWLVEWGIDRPLTVHSGYRTLATNSREIGAAKNSFHMKGKALDFSIPGIPAHYLGRLARIFGVGGVGFYIDKSFVHIDTGHVRTWSS